MILLSFNKTPITIGLRNAVLNASLKSRKMPYEVNSNDHSTTSTSCMYEYVYSSDFLRSEDAWTIRDRISSADADPSNDDPDKQPLREKNRKNTHVPHKEKQPQVVARRNARERRRVHAVNMAFVRLRKMIPVPNSRGKRISKVKTLQNAIRYIREMEMMLNQNEGIFYRNGKYLHYKYEDNLDNLDFEQDF